MRLALAALLVTLSTPARAQSPGVDFVSDAKALLVVGACAEGPAPTGLDAKVYAAHCKKLRASQASYKTSWLAPARTFFAANVPATIPKTVVYPFAGGDLGTALAVFPDADEITTLSLEPAGDPRALTRLKPDQVKTALVTVEKELSSLYKANYSVTMNMIGAMRGAKLPTQLIFGLSALSLNGYEPTSMRYFTVADDGKLQYLTEADVAAAEAIKDTGKRNMAFANVELRFKKPGASREQVYRHIVANLDDPHLAKSPGALRHLQAKGKVAGMTKAASYLLSFGEFKTMRQYVIDNVAWMVSDTTGLPPAYGTPAGFEYETHGTFERSNMGAGSSVTPAWRAMWAAQPKRPLPFRFGYPDGKWRGHLVIMKRAK
ncbi:MAG: hypothetical protein SFX73_02790 [Kofleriaceae bacterium]|nr:hypothetical protein [Kofleriaceae bacterium]